MIDMKAGKSKKTKKNNRARIKRFERLKNKSISESVTGFGDSSQDINLKKSKLGMLGLINTKRVAKKMKKKLGKKLQQSSSFGNKHKTSLFRKITQQQQEDMDSASSFKDSQGERDDFECILDPILTEPQAKNHATIDIKRDKLITIENFPFSKSHSLSKISKPKKDPKNGKNERISKSQEKQKFDKFDKFAKSSHPLINKSNNKRITFMKMFKLKLHELLPSRKYLQKSQEQSHEASRRIKSLIRIASSRPTNLKFIL